MYGETNELPLRAETTTLQELLKIVQADLGPEALIELDQELVLALECPICKTVENVLQPLDRVSFESAHCPACGTLRETKMAHLIAGDEPFLNRTLSSIGVPPLHILRAFNNQEYRFYELTGDLKETLHFNHFTESASHPKSILRNRLHLGEEVNLPCEEVSSARGRVIMHDEHTS
jgi:hypothetical protein